MGRERRARSAHPGVSIVNRVKNGEQIVRARWIDPDTGKAKEFTFETEKITTAEGRRTWMIGKSKEIQVRKLKGATPLGAASTFESAIKLFFEERRLRERTKEAYRSGMALFARWALKQRIKHVQDLQPAHLARFRLHMESAKKLVPLKGGKVGEFTASDEPMSPAAANCHLRSVKAVLNTWRKLGMTPRLDSDAVGEGLGAIAGERPQPLPLRASDCVALLKAAVKHDDARFDLTRDEHDGKRPKGTTPRYQPVAPFVAFVLLSGCRVGEALNLTWADVDLEAKAESGKKAGEIRLLPTATKTRAARTIDLAVSPGLRKLLTALKPKDRDTPHVFGGAEPWSRSRVDGALTRLVDEYGAPEFCWQRLRQTCGTFLVNAPGIYGAASAYRAARQLGHSVAIAEKHYLGLIRGIPKRATTLDSAMEITKELAEILAKLGAMKTNSFESSKAAS